MDKQSRREALMLYRRREHPMETDLWPGIEKELREGSQSEQVVTPRTPVIAPTLRTQRRRARRLSLALVPALAVVLVIGGAIAIFTRLQAPPLASAAEILSRAQEVASKPPFNSFHSMKAGSYTSEGSKYTTTFEEWFVAPRSYCYKAATTSPSAEVSAAAKCIDGAQSTTYMDMWDLAILRDTVPGSIPFDGSASLESVMKMAGGDRFAGAYERKTIGTEQIMGRNAWVVDIALKDPVPQEVIDLGFMANREDETATHWRIWVDQVSYFKLKLTAWNDKGTVISDDEVKNLEIDGKIDANVFKYILPADALIADKHDTKDESLRVGLWQVAAQEARLPLQMGPTPFIPYHCPEADCHISKSNYFVAGNPYYASRTGVVTSVYYNSPTNLTLELLLAQGPVSALQVEGTAKEVENKGVRALFYPAGETAGQRDYTSLVIDRDGVRTVIRNYQYGGHEGAAWILYEQLKPVPHK
ncbi:MAG TPA: hypothetical protein VJ183_06995 [Chloroflexia bacterium]|nr:hypothetical protein [Chloroflexia bacterium]